MKRIALYGGTFDPVHNGHIAVARNLAELFELDEVLFIPAHIAPHKRTMPPTSAFHRYAMLALATEQEPSFRISTLELNAPERPYTVDTLAQLKIEIGQSSRLFFVLGADSWSEITMWREWEQVLTSVNQIVVTRPGYELATAHLTPLIRERIVDLRGMQKAVVAQTLNDCAEKIYLTDAVVIDVSATTVRQAARRVDAKAVLATLVPPAVADYIEKYALYI